jgi:HD superfamily phosphohydrolase
MSPRSASSKSTFVSDCIHGTIVLSSIEKAMISTPVYNRLHNILQNSTAYLTYPGARTSRFAHSLGCAHVAGAIYVNSIRNATPKNRHTFLKSAKEFLASIKVSGDYQKRLREHPKLKSTDKSSVVVESLSKQTFYHNALLFDMQDHDECLAYLVLYQAVRIGALVHDLGHPPFSHIVEHALGEIFERVDATEVNDRTAREENLASVFDALKKKKMEEGPALHERIGCELAEEILDEIAKFDGWDAAQQSLILLLRSILPEILRRPRTFAHGLHGIISGDIDADRLDYVSRDAMAIGVIKTPLPYERLLESFELVIEHSTPVFAPRVQALSAIESFLGLRFAIYKYAVHHHRVMKTDALLRSIICGLSREYLECSDNEPAMNVPLIGQHMGSLWGILDPRIHGTSAEWSQHYMQWDDAWLLTTLRVHHLEHNGSAAQTEDTPDDASSGRSLGRDGSSVLARQLDEFLSNDKQYHSLYKRTDGFLKLEDAFVRSAAPTISTWVSGKRKSRAKSKLSARFWEYAGEIADGSGDAARMRLGLFTSLVLDQVELLGAGGRNCHLLLGNAGKAVIGRRRSPFAEIIIERKAVKPGVTANTKLVRDGKLIAIDDVSCVRANLVHQARMVPPFFVYVRCKNSATANAFEIACAALGRALWEQCELELSKEIKFRKPKKRRS